MGKKGDLSDFERGMVVGARRAVFQKLLIYWDFHAHTTISRVYREWSEKEKISSGSCVDENALLMSEVGGEWAEWFEMIERRQ